MHYLVDGYSAIHAHPELRKALGRRLSHAREMLLQWLQQFQDHTGNRVTVFFDGRGKPGDKAKPAKRKPKKPDECSRIEVVFSVENQSADAVIEQRVGQSGRSIQYLVVTADHAIQNTVSSLGTSSISPDSFFEMIQQEQKDFAGWLEEHRDRTKRKFQRG
jgi:predicted RNA-binding protein with PIN domain